jgi:hypothetical protein
VSSCLWTRVTLPVCGYDDLVTLKRAANRSIDRIDLEQLDMARSAPTEAELHDPWFTATFEGSELSDLHDSATLPLAAKVEQLEEMHALARTFQKQRRTSGLRMMRAGGIIEDV